jgi:WD40 repeat protein
MRRSDQPYRQALAIGPSLEVKFAPDESTLALVSARQLRLWDLTTGQMCGSVAFRNGSGIDFSPRGERLLVGNTGGGSALFTTSSLKLIARASGRNLGEGPGPVFGPDGDYYVQGSWNGDLVVKHADTGEILFHEKDRERMVRQIAHSPDRSVFAYATSTEAELVVWIRHWPFESNPRVARVRLRGDYPASQALALDSDGHIALRQHECLSVFDDAGRVVAAREAKMSGTQEAVAWSSEHDLAATDSSGDEVKCLINFTSSLEERWRVTVPDACSVDYSPSGDMIAVGSWRSGVVLRRT